MKSHLDISKGLNFRCNYPGVAEVCSKRNITTLTPLWERVEAAFEYSQNQRELAGHKPENKKGVSEQNLRVMLSRSAQTVLPWNSGRKKWRPLARCVGVALGNTSLQILFGSPEELEQSVKRNSVLTPQRSHIQALMQKAFNPLTGKCGITRNDFAKLSSAESLRYLRLAPIMDADTAETTHYLPFHPDTGLASEWALDLAEILGEPVERVFPYSAANFCQKQKLDGFPLDQQIHLEEAQYIPETRAPLQMQSITEQREALLETLEETLEQTDKFFTPRHSRLLSLRFIEGLTLEETGLQIPNEQGGPITKERVRQLEGRAKEVLKRRFAHYGVRKSDIGHAFD